MNPLEQAIREAASKGRLSGASIHRDPDGRGWQANAPSPSGSGWSVIINEDPVEALLGALIGWAPMTIELTAKPVTPSLSDLSQGVFD